MTAVTAAERILMGLGISDPKEIDLEAIAWSRGVLVEYRPLDGCDATIVGSAHKAVIAVNSRRSPERRRFSIGHELGHWHHHKGRILFCGSKDVENPADDALNPERHADEFASDLILPNYLLHPRLRKIKRITLAVAREVGHEFFGKPDRDTVEDRSVQPFPTYCGLPQQETPPLVQARRPGAGLVVPP
jgi:Zn-dependent peptidase ImmA (M78 family)